MQPFYEDFTPPLVGLSVALGMEQLFQAGI